MESKKKKLKTKKQRGITLIALVVTIVVLLILASVSITVVFGDNGILELAQEAGEKTNEAVKNDISSIGDLEDELNDFMHPPVKMISFSIKYDNEIVKTFETEEGTTWKEFIEKNPDSGIYQKPCDINELGSSCTWKKPNAVSVDSDYLTGKAGAPGEAWLYYGGECKLIDIIHDLYDEIENSAELPWVDCNDEIREKCEYGILFYYKGAECVKGDTEILNDKFENITLAKDMSDGDTIAYYNFETGQVEEGTVSKVYIHKNATNFVKYTFEDGSYLEATDYHPIYTTEGWRSLTRRNGYEVPKVGDKVKTEDGWKVLASIEEYKGKEDCYDFAIVSKDGKVIDNYFANGTLVQNSIK